MTGYNEAETEPDPPESLKGNYSLRRLMIDKDHQGKGCGRGTVYCAPEFIRTWPRGKAEYCVLSCEPENETAKKLDASFGSEGNGETDDDEIAAALKL